MPFNGSGGDGPGELVLMFLATLVVEMDFVGGGDGDGGVDGDIGDSDPDNLLVVALELANLGLGEEAHDLPKFKSNQLQPKYNSNSYKYINYIILSSFSHEICVVSRLDVINNRSLLCAHVLQLTLTLHILVLPVVPNRDIQ